jgi:hypothetical protein
MAMAVGRRLRTFGRYGLIKIIYMKILRLGEPHGGSANYITEPSQKISRIIRAGPLGRATECHAVDLGRRRDV